MFWRVVRAFSRVDEALFRLGNGQSRFCRVLFSSHMDSCELMAWLNQMICPYFIVCPSKMHGCTIPNCLTFVKTTATGIAYRQKIGRSLKILVLCNSRRFYKRQAIGSIMITTTSHHSGLRFHNTYECTSVYCLKEVIERGSSGSVADPLGALPRCGVFLFYILY